jgi:hypothetical protein
MQTTLATGWVSWFKYIRNPMNKINQIMITYIFICCMEKDGLWAGNEIKTAIILVTNVYF